MKGFLPSPRQKVGFQSNDFRPQEVPGSVISFPEDYHLPKLAETRCVYIGTTRYHHSSGSAIF